MTLMIMNCESLEFDLGNMEDNIPRFGFRNLRFLLISELPKLEVLPMWPTQGPVGT